jgi:hypothetical protein
MAQFYGHYLKGEPRGAWTDFGERHIDKHRRSPMGRAPTGYSTSSRRTSSSSRIQSAP